MIARLLKIPIRFWHKGIAPFLPPSCRFHPSCSQYALEALDRHSLPRAMRLIVWRLLRCQPFCSGGYDPVPDAGQPPRPDCHHHPHHAKANKA